MDGQTSMTKLIVAFHNFVNAQKNKKMDTDLQVTTVPTNLLYIIILYTIVLVKLRSRFFS